MNRNRWVALGAVLAIIAGVAWYFGSPWYALRGLKAAAESNDSDALSAYIDFPALREDLKAEVLGQMMAEAQKDKGEFSGLAMALGPAIVGPMIDGFVTPQGLRAAMVSNRSKTGPSSKQPPAAGTFAMDDKPVVSRRSFSEFTVGTAKDPGNVMVFKRHGLGWKLSGVDIAPPRGSSQR